MYPQVVCYGPSPLHSPFPSGRALTVPAHLALHRKPRSARARCGRLLLLRPLVSGAPLPPPASPTASACKRPMTARPCPSRFARNRSSTLSLTALIDLSPQAHLDLQRRVLPAQGQAEPASGHRHRLRRHQDGHRWRWRRGARADRRPFRRPQPRWEAAAGANGCGGCGALAPRNKAQGWAQPPAQASRTAGGRLGRRVAALVTPRPSCCSRLLSEKKRM